MEFNFIRKYIVIIMIVAGFGLGRTFSQNQKQIPAFYKLAETPPMGWNSWDCYGPTVTEDEVKANTDYMAGNLKKFGWEYVVVDIRWYVENTKAHGYNSDDPIFCMDEFGRFIPATNKFPSASNGNGFKPLADYIHSKGLKFGIHIMRGIPVVAVNKNTPIKGTEHYAVDVFSKDMQCEWLHDMYSVDSKKTGAQEYYNSLFELYAQWEVDFVKVDNLSRPYHKAEIEMIRKAIDGCGRPMVFSTSPGATALENATHVKNHANMWRICNDFWDNWEQLYPMFEQCNIWSKHCAKGHWADADMLPLGRISLRGERGDDRMTKFTKAEQITLMNLWCIFRSPLMFGGDLPSNDEFTLSLLSNTDLLAINQNSKNNRQLKNINGLITWVADSDDEKNKYVAFFNTQNKEDCLISVSLSELNLSGRFKAFDLWSKEEVTIDNGILKKRVSPHGSAIYKLQKE